MSRDIGEVLAGLGASHVEDLRTGRVLYDRPLPEYWQDLVRPDGSCAVCEREVVRGRTVQSARPEVQVHFRVYHPDREVLWSRREAVR